jgi:hypothetical protein
MGQRSTRLRVNDALAARRVLSLLIALGLGAAACDDDCNVPLGDCPDSCTVVEGYRLRNTGCLSRELEPAGCADPGAEAPSVLTPARSPEGSCWSFPVQALPSGFEPGCDADIASAPVCTADDG